MQRRQEIRAAMQGLLSPAQRPSESIARVVEEPVPLHATGPQASWTLPDSRLRTLQDIQITLENHGIICDTDGIANALLDRLCACPELCKGLMAHYMLRDAI